MKLLNMCIQSRNYTQLPDFTHKVSTSSANAMPKIYPLGQIQDPQSTMFTLVHPYVTCLHDNLPPTFTPCPRPRIILISYPIATPTYHFYMVRFDLVILSISIWIEVSYDCYL